MTRCSIFAFNADYKRCPEDREIYDLFTLYCIYYGSDIMDYFENEM